MASFLIGGGWDPAVTGALYGPFLDVAGPAPTVACLVVDEGDGDMQFSRWAGALRRAGRCEPVPVLVPLDGAALDTALLGDADALLVCGGLTPAYAAALAPAAAEVRAWLREGDRPYAGFSAGAAVAAGRAVVGGWRVGGVAVCPEDAAEDLDEVELVDGLGLVPFAVDVHGAQWGTLPRLIAAVAAADGLTGVAIDENTLLTYDESGARVSGTGNAWLVRPGREGVDVRRAGPGSRPSELSPPR